MYLTGRFLLLAISGIYSACNSFDFDLDSEAVLMWMHWCHSFSCGPPPPLLPRFQLQHMTKIVLMHEKVSLSTGACPGLHTGKLKLLKGIFSSTFFVYMCELLTCVHRTVMHQTLIWAAEVVKWCRLNLELTCHIFQLLQMDRLWENLCLVLYCYYNLICTQRTTHKLRQVKRRYRMDNLLKYTTQKTSWMTVAILSDWNMQLIVWYCSINLCSCPAVDLPYIVERHLCVSAVRSWEL